MKHLDNLKEAVEALETILTAPENQINYREVDIWEPGRKVFIIKLPEAERIAVEKTYWKLKKIIEND